MRPAAVLLVVLGLALVAAGCGGDEDGDVSSATPTAEWADGYCAAIVDWATELRRAGGELRNFGALSEEGFDQAGADVRSATDAFTDELRGLGMPDTEFGEEAREAVDTFVTALEGDLADVEQAVEDVSGPSDISKAAGSITRALSSMNVHFATMVESLQGIDTEEELQSALEKAESCDAL